MNADILIVDDEEDIRDLIQGILEDEGYRIRQAGSAKDAYAQMEKAPPDLLILDIWLQGSDEDGMGVLARVKEAHPDLPVLMISGHGTIETAVSAIKKGAYDFIEKPFKADRLLVMIARALEAANLRRENQDLREKAEGIIYEMIGDSPPMAALRQAIEKIAPTNSRVLISGEAGSGKEVAARLLHRLSERNNQPFMALNCATLHPERIEEALFGIEHSGTIKPGVLERADGGTLLLDGVGDMPLETQGKIVRVLQEQNFTRLGGSKNIPYDVRIIASTNRNLEEEIKQGNFREDLYYRLSVVPLKIPLMRERLSDIPALAHFFMKLYCRQAGQPECAFSAEALTLLKRHEWPGNVRQLRNAVEWVMIMGGLEAGEEITRAHLPPDITGQGGALPSQRENDYLLLSLREARESFEREYLHSQISRFEGNVSETAKFIGMERSALHRKLKSLEISPSGKQDNDSGDSTSTPLRKRA
ncbi:MAG: sigma-54-dependent Fis family transcriptional regulator [Rhodospirillales bacterium]|nr:MAG: sigma-54-dependent Fis family transcriptional regulator [Rhodospirillales bacterium]